MISKRIKAVQDETFTRVRSFRYTFETESFGGAVYLDRDSIEEPPPKEIWVTLEVKEGKVTP